MHPKNTARKRPSASMVVAALALVLALAGSAIAGTDAATRKLSKAKISKIAKKQANGVLNVRAASLDVNSAKTAGAAQTAQTAQSAVDAENAAAVGGVRLVRLDYRGADQSAPQVIFDEGGLKITAECLASTEIAMTATTTENGSSIYASHVATDFDEENPTTNDLEGEFDTNDAFNLMTAADTGLTDSGLTTFEFDAPNGSAVSGTFATDEFTSNPATCRASGHLMVS
jgi:hypothetical protein